MSGLFWSCFEVLFYPLCLQGDSTESKGGLGGTMWGNLLKCPDNPKGSAVLISCLGGQITYASPHQTCHLCCCVACLCCKISSFYACCCTRVPFCMHKHILRRNFHYPEAFFSLSFIYAFFFLFTFFANQVYCNSCMPSSLELSKHICCSATKTHIVCRVFWSSLLFRCILCCIQLLWYNTW